MNELEKLRKELAEAKADAVKAREALAAKQPKITMKVSEKGGLSIYGMGRFPITFYKEQWVKLLGMKDEILDFIKANDSKLVTKD